MIARVIAHVGFFALALVTVHAESVRGLQCPVFADLPLLPCAAASLAKLERQLDSVSFVPPNVDGLSAAVVIHYSPLTQRRAELEKWAQSSEVGLTWLGSMFDRERLDPEVVSCFFGAHARADGAVAGTLAHVALLHMQVKKGWGKMLLLEDDAYQATSVPATRLRAELSRAMACTDNDVLQVAPNAAGMIVGLNGAHKLLSLLASSPLAVDLQGTPSLSPVLKADSVEESALASWDGARFVPATDLMLIAMGEGLQYFLEHPSGSHCEATQGGEDFSKECSTWQSYDWNRLARWQQQPCTRVTIGHLSTPLWTNGNKGSWYTTNAAGGTGEVRDAGIRAHSLLQLRQRSRDSDASLTFSHCPVVKPSVFLP